MGKSFACWGSLASHMLTFYFVSSFLVSSLLPAYPAISVTLSPLLSLSLSSGPTNGIIVDEK